MHARHLIAHAASLLGACAAAVSLALVLPTPAQAASALVLQDQTALRAAPKDAAPLLTPLWRGEALEVRGSNTRARGLYLRRGFVDVGLRRGYYPAAQGREDALVMSLTVDLHAETPDGLV